MILLISSNPEVERCAPVLARELGERIECADTLRTAAAKLREQSYELLLLDQRFFEMQASAVDALLSHAVQAVPLFFNPAITGASRLALEARAAIRRREHDQRAALENALGVLRNELRSEVTGILLSSQLALDGRTVPEALAANLKSVCSLAERLSKKLA